MKIMKLLIGVGAPLLVAICAHAKSDTSTFGDLDQLRARNTLLEAQVKNAELEKRLNDLSMGTPTMGSKNIHSQPFISAPARFAQVLSVSGHSAIILLPNGATYSAKVGSKIPGVGMVKAISIHEVIVKNDNTITALPFAETDMPITVPAAYFGAGVH